MLVLVLVLVVVAEILVVVIVVVIVVVEIDRIELSTHIFFSGFDDRQHWLQGKECSIPSVPCFPITSPGWM